SLSNPRKRWRSRGDPACGPAHVWRILRPFNDICYDTPRLTGFRRPDHSNNAQRRQLNEEAHVAVGGRGLRGVEWFCCRGVPRRSADEERRNEKGWNEKRRNEERR